MDNPEQFQTQKQLKETMSSGIQLYVHVGWVTLVLLCVKGRFTAILYNNYVKLCLIYTVCKV